MSSRRFVSGLLVLGLLAGAAARTNAETVVPITNGGFESPGLAAGQPYSGPIDGWQASGPGRTGVWNIQGWGSEVWQPAWKDSAVASHQQVAMLSGPATLSQTLSDTVIATSTYTLSFDVGSPLGTRGNYQVSWYAGNDLLWRSGGFVPADAVGDFKTFSASFMDDGSAGTVGKAFRIELSSLGSHPVAIDNVRLVHVPEPSTLAALAGMAGVGLVFAGRSLRRRRN